MYAIQKNIHSGVKIQYKTRKFLKHNNIAFFFINKTKIKTAKES